MRVSIRQKESRKPILLATVLLVFGVTSWFSFVGNEASSVSYDLLSLSAASGTSTGNAHEKPISNNLPTATGTSTPIEATQAGRKAQASEQQPKQPPSKTHKSEETFYCAANRTSVKPEGKSMHHFPHAALFLAPCWSYFMEHNAQTCVLLLDPFTFRKTVKQTLSIWTIDFLNAMGCSVKLWNETFVENNNTFTPILRGQNELEYHFWFNRSEHAWALRDQILDHYNQRGLDTSPATKTNYTSLIRIGVLDRPETRSIANLNQLSKALLNGLEDVAVDVTWFSSGTPFIDQVQWFIQHDVIVLAHGAALTNAMFLRPSTIVVELFPPNYFPADFFSQLVRISGANLYQLYTGANLTGVDDTALEENYQRGKSDYLENGQSMSNRHHWRNIDFEVPVSDVVKLIQKGILEHLRARPYVPPLVPDRQGRIEYYINMERKVAFENKKAVLVNQSYTWP